MRAAAVVAVAVAAAAMVVVATASGVGLTPDSASYAGAATELAGRGRLWDPVAGTPFTSWPPLYPVVLAALAEAGPSVPGAARWTNVGCVAATVALAGWAVHRAGRGGVAAGLAAGAAAAALPTVANATLVHAETPFTLLALAAVVAAAEHLRRPRPALLAAVCALLVAATATRYLGVAAVGAAAAALALRRRWADAAVALGVPLAALAGWLAWAAPADPTGRAVAWHPPAVAEWRGAVEAVSRWWSPVPAAEGLRLAVTVALVAAAVVALGRAAAARRRAGDPLVLVATLFLAAYGAALLVSKSLVDALTPIDTRLLSPVLPVLAVALAAAAPAAGRAAAVAAALAVAVVAGQAVRTVAWSVDHRDEPRGYASELWRRSPTLAALRELPPGVAVYTNDRAAVYLGTGRTARTVPRRTDPWTRRPDPDLAEDVDRLAADVAAGRAVVVWFHGEAPGVLPEAELVRRAGITDAVEHFDATVHGPAAPPLRVP